MPQAATDMPSLARKILVCAAADGLVIQPLTSRGQRPAAPVKISYGSPSISAISRDQVPDVSKADSSFEAFGIIGRRELIQAGLSRVRSLTSVDRPHHGGEIELSHHHHTPSAGSTDSGIPHLCGD